MSVSVVAKITPKLEMSRVETLATGVSGGDLEVKLPAELIGDHAANFKPVELTCTKSWTAVIPLAASTPVNLNLSALAGGKGDTAFTAYKFVDVRNNEAVGSGRNLIIGAEGSANEAYEPFGAAGSKLTIPPGTARQLYTRETAGWTVSTHALLKLDPGSNPVNCTVTIGG